MTRKTVKDLEVELSLIKKDHEELKAKFAILASKCERLEKTNREGKSMNFKCDKCEEEFSSKKNLQKHKRIHMSCLPGPFQCDQCDTSFDIEWKCEAHKKTHSRNECDKCDKTFKYKTNLRKHMTACHGKTKLYCHFFNNDIECPFDREHFFAHEDAELCKYDEICERINCMYKHEYEDEEDEDDAVVSDSNVEKHEDKSDEEEDDVVDDNNVEKHEDECDDEDDDESVVDMKNVIEATEEPKKFQCDVCNFETSNKAKFDKHKFEKHSVQGKWVCCGCKWEFATRKEFNSHKYHGCSL